MNKNTLPAYTLSIIIYVNNQTYNHKFIINKFMQLVFSKCQLYSWTNFLLLT